MAYNVFACTYYIIINYTINDMIYTIHCIRYIFVELHYINKIGAISWIIVYMYSVYWTLSSTGSMLYHNYDMILNVWLYVVCLTTSTYCICVYARVCTAYCILYMIYCMRYEKRIISYNVILNGS